MTVVERAGEVLVRRLDRSAFLRKSAATIFGFTAAAAVQGIFAPRALANACQTTLTASGCKAPGTNGYWCANIDGSCIGGNCDTRVCTYDTTYEWHTTACWCTDTRCYDCSTGGYCGYWHCCDCKCGGTLCGCRGFVYTCQCAGAATPDCACC